MFLRHVLFGVPSSLAAAVLLSATTAGCGKKSAPPPPPEQPREVYGSMMEDPQFESQLKDQRAAQKKILGDRTGVERKMQALVAQARTALGTGADDAAVKAELEGNPGKYPEWKALYARILELNSDYQKNLARTRELARVRIAQEAQDKADVAAGKARVRVVPREEPSPEAHHVAK